MKSIITLLVLILFGYSGFCQTLLLNDDFESYNQGSISSQNSGWSNISNATADIVWNGGAFVACSSSDMNEAYLSFVSGDDITAQVGLNAENGQVSVKTKVTMTLGFEIMFFGNDIFYTDSYNDVAGDFELQYVIDFATDFVHKYVNGSFENSVPIQSNLNSLSTIRFSNSSGSFKLGCLSVSDVTDIDGDGYFATNDCNDNNPDINPGATEIPYDGVDNDCNSATLDDDLDGDGYIAANDCNDTNASQNPGATEAPYNGIDDDCNPATLDDDLDGDGYVAANDCNDANAAQNPGATEVPYNGIDDDCNPATLDDDLDGDGYTNANDCNDTNAAQNPSATEVPYNGIDDDCNPNTLDDDLDNDGYIAANDCNDNNAAQNPGATEVPYNGIDDDCNPNTLDDDLDNDGYIAANDCNDNNAAQNPGATEVPYNGIDDDCNPNTLDDDLDIDGYIAANDCNDNNAAQNPGAIEVQNGIDDNCDGQVDETTATDNLYGNKFIFSPNPVIDVLNISGFTSIDYVKISTMNGIVVGKYFTSPISMSLLPSGAYFATIVQKDGQQFSKIILKN